MKKIIYGVLPAMLTAMVTGCSSDTVSELMPENPETPVQESNEVKAPLKLDNDMIALIDTHRANAVDLIRTVIGSAGKTENVVFSPFSIYTSVSMLANATDGENLEEILAFLHITDQGKEIQERDDLFPLFPPSGQEDKALEFLNRNNARLIDNIPYLDSGVTLKMANSVWTDNGFDIRPQFSDIMTTTYSAPTFTHDFSTENVADLINSWVSEKTDNLIPRLMTAPLDGPVALATAMYFKGGWNQPFDPANTSRQNFTCGDGTEVEVDMMHHSNVMAYMGEAYGGYTLTLTFGNSLYYMSFFLPVDEVNLTEVAESLSLGRFQYWHLATGRYGETEVDIPKFSVQADYDLRNILQTLGVNGIFSPSRWNGLTDSSEYLWVQQAVHSTAFSIDETGSEAASAGGLTLGAGHPVHTIPDPIPERIFRVDRPFIFTVMEHHCSIPLLVGCINKL
ncbi:MAG: serpin family protein [Bacteroides sp.]|nr:serpin family protein [Bacteroides sp.]